MGALSSNYVKLTTILSWKNAAGETVQLQTFIDRILPNLLPLAIVVAIYLFFKKKGPKFLPVIMVILVVAEILSFFSIV